ncbi:MAG: MaoC family dehydratase N-terminal domain-containing protein [Candidatus Rokubacteria bacterium]|nr:MaoC family dehydratase N-terminal domain-containing protein [Candidatus Rokubacteria bacterium]
MAADPVRGKYYEELEVGDRLISSRRTVSEGTIDLFAGATGDFSEVHTDAEGMKETPFGERIGHGLLALSVMQGLMWQTAYNVGTVVATLGWDGVRFTAPLRIGDTVQAQWTIRDKRESRSRPGFGIVVEDCRLVNQRKETVLTGSHVMLVCRRPDGSTP